MHIANEKTRNAPSVQSAASEFNPFLCFEIYQYLQIIKNQSDTILRIMHHSEIAFISLMR